MKEVFEGTLWEAEIVKGLLLSGGVKCMVRDETMGAVTSPYLTLGGNVKVLVDDGDYVKAHDIVSSR